MRRLYDFKCDETDAYFERLTSADVTDVKCNCGADAGRVVSAVRVSLDPISGDFPKATRRWAEQRKKQIGIERRNKANHGTHD